MNKSESKYFNTAVKMDLALIALLKQKPFEYITVSELCEAAGVNRSTFYLHYETIDDLLSETTQYLLNRFLSYFSVDKASLNLADCELRELNFVCEKYLTPYLTYIAENKDVFSIALSNGQFFQFDKLYKWLFESIFCPILDRFHYPPESRNYVMMYYLNGVMAIITEWLKNKCKTPVADLSRIIQECIFGFQPEVIPLIER